MKKILFTTTALLSCLHFFAQDTHYWTQQFGTRSVLMGGAAVAGAPDNSMIFYNPGALAFIDSGSISINANLYQAENTRIKNVLTENKDFKTLQLTSVPLLTSGLFKMKNPNMRLGYGIFSPTAFQFRGSARLQGAYPVVSDVESPGNEEYVGDESIFSRLRELIFSLGLATRLNDRWAIGVTGMVNIRSHNFIQTEAARYFLNNTAHTLVSSSLTQSFNYYNVRLMPKVGIAYRGNQFSWGATVTAPGLRLLGTGSLGVDALGTNVKTTNGGRTDVIANGRESKLKSTFKSPYSVAMGLQYKRNKNTFAVSSQYFGAQDVFTVLKATEPIYIKPSAAASFIDNSQLQVITAMRPVLNVAVGFIHDINDGLSISGSVRNNASYYDNNLLNTKGIKPDISTWNIYHVLGGVTMRRPRSSMSLGLSASFGSDKNRLQQIGLAAPTEINFLQMPTQVTEASYTGIGFLMGYNFFFKKG